MFYCWSGNKWWIVRKALLYGPRVFGKQPLHFLLFSPSVSTQCCFSKIWAQLFKPEPLPLLACSLDRGKAEQNNGQMGSSVKAAWDLHRCSGNNSLSSFDVHGLVWLLEPWVESASVSKACLHPLRAVCTLIAFCAGVDRSPPSGLVLTKAHPQQSPMLCLSGNSRQLLSQQPLQHSCYLPYPMQTGIF